MHHIKRNRQVLACITLAELVGGKNIDLWSVLNVEHSQYILLSLAVCWKLMLQKLIGTYWNETILNVVPQYTGFHVSQPRNCSLVPSYQIFHTHPAALSKNSPHGARENFGLRTRLRNWGRHWYAHNYIKRQWRLNILGILLLNTYQYQTLQVLSWQGKWRHFL